MVRLRQGKEVGRPEGHWWVRLGCCPPRVRLRRCPQRGRILTGTEQAAPRGLLGEERQVARAGRREKQLNRWDLNLEPNMVDGGDQPRQMTCSQKAELVFG